MCGYQNPIQTLLTKPRRLSGSVLQRGLDLGVGKPFNDLVLVELIHLIPGPARSVEDTPTVHIIILGILYRINTERVATSN